MPKKYQLFDGEDEKFELVVTSNHNIRGVCRVLTQCSHKSNEERIYYAQQGDIPPESHDDDGRGQYTFKNYYDAATMWPALVDVLFFDAPKLIEIDEMGNAVVPKKARERNDTLIRSQVMAGRDDFLARFGVNPFEVKNLFSMLSSGLTPKTIQQLLNPADLPEEVSPKHGSKTTSKDGATPSGQDTDSGAKP